ncbi:MAG TPA: flagellar hook-basal body complex protein FliE [Candidatus Binataceae bacterium]
MNIVVPTQGLTGLAPITPESATAASQQGGFDTLLEQVNSVLEKADQLAAGYAQGKVGLTDAVLASENADTTFQMVMAVRNRALAAYQEIMNIQV